MSERPTKKFEHHIKYISADLKRYIENRVKLATLKVVEKVSRYAAESIQKVLGLIFLFSAFVCLLVALALFIGTLLHSVSLGFVVVSGPFLIGGFSLFKMRPKSLRKKIQSNFEEEFVDLFDNDHEKS
ncbi:MAG TPA: phage holin family protein [Balneolaceae bacterium]|nr:phage holin family protein [Balneolaceae bacterium]